MNAPTALAVLWTFFAVPVRAAIPSTATLRGVDVYRSETVTRDMIQRQLGQKIALFVTRSNEGGTALKFASQLKGELESDVSRLGDLAFVSMSVGRTVRASAYDLYITFDVVDAQDRLARMPFHAPPQGKLPDPGGLLVEWRAYWSLCAAGRALGEPVSERPACPAFYCPWVARTEQLKELEAVFAREVPARQAELARVLAEQADPRDRVAAAYLLAFSTSAAETTERMLGALQDPDAEVRAAALSVLADIAVYSPDVLIDPHKLLTALDYPTTQDRSKALGVVAGMAGNRDFKSYVASRASIQLARLLRSLDPSVRDLAYTILGMVSGQNIPPEDFGAWDRWAQEAAVKAPEPAKPSRPKR